MKILLFYFSGTGNTKAVTNLLSEGFTASGNEVTVFSIIDSYHELSIDDFDMIGIGYPVYAFSAPKNVVSWLNKLNIQSKKVFLYNTSGGYSRINNAASNKLIRILKKNNNHVFYERTIVMPSNWYVKYDDRLSKQLYHTAEKKVKYIIQDIINQKERLNHPNIVIKVIAFLSYYFEGELGTRLFSKTLYANDDCNACGLCAKNCPVSNIKISEKVTFSNKCIWCMKCIYTCPQSAIGSTFMSFCIHKGGYNIGKIINDTDNTGDFLSDNNKNNYKSLYSYISDIEK